MIDRDAFDRVMAAFADRINRPLAPFTSEMYYDVLSESLTTDEFLAGARLVFRGHQYNTWPAPEQFILAVKPEAAASLAGAEAFEEVLAIAANPGTSVFVRSQKIAELGPIVERAYRAAGGRRAFENVLESDVKWLRKSFLEAYDGASTTAIAGQKAVAALASVDRQVAGLVTRVAEQLDYRQLAAGDK